MKDDSWFSFELDNLSKLFAQQLVRSSNFGPTDSGAPWVWLPKCSTANPKVAARQANNLTCNEKVFPHPQEQISFSPFTHFDYTDKLFFGH